MQVGLVNTARNVKGVQLGLINIANDVEGVSLGILPVSVAKGAQPVLWTSTAYLLNAGVRLRGGPLVTTPSVSYSGDDGIEDAVPGITLGVPIAIGPFRIEPDIGYRLEIKSDQVEPARHRVVYRLGLGWQPHALIRVHAGGGAIQTLRKVDSSVESGPTDPLAFVGISTLH